MYISTVEKFGDDYTIPLPEEVVEALKLKEGDQIHWCRRSTKRFCHAKRND